MTIELTQETFRNALGAMQEVHGIARCKGCGKLPEFELSCVDGFVRQDARCQCTALSALVKNPRDPHSKMAAAVDVALYWNERQRGKPEEAAK